MGILNHPTRIKGINPINNNKTIFAGTPFDKTIPIGEHNYPWSKYTEWKIFGYRTDKVSGIKRPYWITKKLRTGEPLRCPELDGIYSATPTQYGQIAPREEKNFIKNNSDEDR